MKNAVLILTIIGAVFALTIGTGTALCFSAIGDMGRHMGEAATAAKANAAGGQQVVVGFAQTILGLVGGINAFRRFGQKNTLKIGIIPLLIAMALSVFNTCSFFTSGVLFGVAALLAFLGRKEVMAEGPVNYIGVPLPSGQESEVSPTLRSRLRAAGQLTARLAQRTALATMTLPSAYRALGKHIYKTGGFRDEFVDFYGKLDHLTAELKAISQQTAARPGVEGIAAKAKGAAVAAKEMVQSNGLELRGKQVLATLGESAFRTHGEQTGPPELTRPIVELRSQIAALDDEIARLSQADGRHFLTPKRIAVGGICLVALIGLIVIANIGKSVNDASRSSDSSSNQNNTRTTAIPVWADLLLSEYNENEISADSKYKDKILEVAGEVESVKVQFGTNHVYVTGGEKFQIFSVDCSFDDSSAGKLASLSKGQPVRVRGRCDGLFGNVFLKDCRLVGNN